jgi:hypothetical protein
MRHGDDGHKECLPTACAPYFGDMATSQGGNDFENELAAARERAERAERVADLLRENRVEARQLVEAARDHAGEARLFYIDKALAMLSPLKVFLSLEERAAAASEALAAGDDAVLAYVRGGGRERGSETTGG